MRRDERRRIDGFMAMDAEQTFALVMSEIWISELKIDRGNQSRKLECR